MTISLNAAPVAFVVTGDPDSRELRHCWQAVLARRGAPVLVGRGRTGGPADVYLPWALAADYCGLVLIRAADSGDEPVAAATARFVRGFFELGLPVAASSHATLALAAPELVRGRTIAAPVSAGPRLAAAGAVLSDRRVVRCEAGSGDLISSTSAADLPAFCAAFTLAFSDRLAARTGAGLGS